MARFQFYDLLSVMGGFSSNGGFDVTAFHSFDVSSRVEDGAEVEIFR